MIFKNGPVAVLVTFLYFLGRQRRGHRGNPSPFQKRAIGELKPNHFSGQRVVADGLESPLRFFSR